MADTPARRTGATDDFEAGIEAGGRVLHRDKMVARRLAIIMAISTIGFLALSIAYALGWGADVWLVARVLTFLITPLFPFVLLTRTVVRTVVSTEEVNVKWGLWGPRVPVSAITRCEVLTAEQIRHEQGLFAPKLVVEGPEGRPRKKFELLAPGQFSQAVWLEWEDDGVARAAVVGSDDPATLADAIQEARRGHGGARVEAAAEQLADEEAEGPAQDTTDVGASAARRG